jgi:septal ring factor EnvC (AmiA/AmiB activator)
MKAASILLFQLTTTLSLFYPIDAFPATKAQRLELNLREITESEINKLAEKLGAAIANCPHKSPDDQVIASVSNQTDEIIDKAKVAELIREVLRPKKNIPQIAPFYEVRARLTAEKSEIQKKKKRHFEATYTLSAEVFQDEKKICEKTETLKKSGLID